VSYENQCTDLPLFHFNRSFWTSGPGTSGFHFFLFFDPLSQLQHADLSVLSPPFFRPLMCCVVHLLFYWHIPPLSTPLRWLEGRGPLAIFSWFPWPFPVALPARLTWIQPLSQDPPAMSGSLAGTASRPPPLFPVLLSGYL